MNVTKVNRFNKVRMAIAIIAGLAVIFLLVFIYIYNQSMSGKEQVNSLKNQKNENNTYVESQVINEGKEKVDEENVKRVSDNKDMPDKKQPDIVKEKSDSLTSEKSGCSSDKKQESIKVESLNKKKVWVVDHPAWSETVEDKTKPIYEYKETWWTYGNGTYKTFYSEKEAYNAYLNDTTGEHSSWGNGEYEEVFIGYEKKTIEHPEQGHWEYL